MVQLLQYKSLKVKGAKSTSKSTKKVCFQSVSKMFEQGTFVREGDSNHQKGNYKL